MRNDRLWWGAAAVVCCTGIATPTHHAQAAEAVLAGLGADTCAGYAESMRLDTKYTDTLYRSWAQGLMSGMNGSHAAHHEPWVDLLSVSYPVQAQTAFLHGYCDQHPLASFAEAVAALYSDMLGRLPLQRN